MSTHRMILRLTGLVVLIVLGLFLYADLLSVHQLHPITQATIDSVLDTQARGDLIAVKDKQDQKERRHKMALEVGLGIDLCVLLWLTVGLFRRSREATAG
jgi:hypothetical protein